MAVDDFLEPEVGVAVAITAALASPKVRGLLRKGAVYSLAGVLVAGDAAVALANGIKRGISARAIPAAAPESAEAATPVAEAIEVSAAPVDGAATSKHKSAKTKGIASGEDANE